MKQFFSKKWVFFASRPTPLLYRQFRNNWYLYGDKICDLKITEVLVIGEKGIASMFVKKREEDKTNLQVKKDYKNRQAVKYFQNFKKIIEHQNLHGKNPFEQMVESSQKAGPILLYSHYIERVLTEKSQKLAQMKRKEKIYLKKLLRLNNEFRDKTVRIQDEYYKEACEYLKKKYPIHKEIDYYLIKELINNRKVNYLELSKRKRFYVLISKRDSIQFFTDRKASAILKKEKFIEKKIANIKELKGFIAFPGKVLGKIVIIKKLADFKKKTDGKIIVSPMTIPQFVPYLKNVKAIITDEGGINCHAAISAREFKIPCIVGTKIATKALKDGDLVEVDANKGLIRLLERRTARSVSKKQK